MKTLRLCIILFAVLAITAALTGCAPAAAPNTTATPIADVTPLQEATVPPTDIAETTAATAAAPTEDPVAQGMENEAEALQSEVPAVHSATAVASGILVKSCGEAAIDYSNTADGYVMVCYTAETDRRLKVQVSGPFTTYTYNLTPGEWTAFPLSDENGTYKITVYINAAGSKYAAVLSLTQDVTLHDEFAPFLHSNQFVNFDAAPNAVAAADRLCAGQEDLDKVACVYNFVVKGMTYDAEMAATVKSGYVPDLDRVLENMTGICFDYAALMTGMLRSQGIPCKLVVGYAGDVYHAWIHVWTRQTGWVEGIVFFDGTSWQRMDPTFASSARGNTDILDFIGDGTNYSVKYLY